MTRSLWIRSISCVLVLACAAPLGPLPSSHARAEAPAAVPSTPGEVLVVLGSNEPGGVDPELAALGALAKSPFDAFPRKTLLKRVAVALALGKDSEVSLPNGRTLRLSLVEHLPDGRFRLRVAINKPGERDYLPLMTVSAAAGDPFFIAGQKYQGGTLILGVRVLKTL